MVSIKGPSMRTTLSSPTISSLFFTNSLLVSLKSPEVERPFKTPLVPLVPILGIAVCTFMIVALDIFTLASAGVWMVLGLFVYFLYSKKHSNLNSK
jgi:APA family basic amino acid/polyamine antiporter